MISNLLLKPKENEKIIIIEDTISKEEIELLKEHIKVVGE